MVHQLRGFMMIICVWKSTRVSSHLLKYRWADGKVEDSIAGSPGSNLGASDNVAPRGAFVSFALFVVFLQRKRLLRLPLVQHHFRLTRETPSASARCTKPLRRRDIRIDVVTRRDAPIRCIRPSAEVLSIKPRLLSPPAIDQDVGDLGGARRGAGKAFAPL